MTAPLGILLICLAAWLCSENRAALPSWRWILGALAMQFVLAFLILRVPLIWDALGLANLAVIAIERATLQGSSYMFGYLGGADLPFALNQGAQPPVIIAFQILPLVIVFSALAAVFWHWGVLRAIVQGLSWALQKSLQVSGVVGLMGGANLFLGVVEAPLAVRAYFDKVSRAELFAMMVLTMSTISGAILVLYAQTLSALIDNAVGHMISASLISLPAALLLARLMVPAAASETPSKADDTSLRYDSTIDAIVTGTMDGMKLFLAVIAVIIVIFSLVALADSALSLLPDIAGEPITIRRAFGWLFAPIMWLMGVPWADADVAGRLMGTKAILNEYVAYLEFAALPSEALAGRSQLITIYALCGFANLASIGLLISTIATLAPSRKAEVAQLGIKSWLAGNGASLMTGAVAGLVSYA
ncbi:MAG: nucleoside transporter C-terminal domain-containing protein [Pseudomonadota bacterium]